MAQFCREYSKTGKGGPGILPPEFDPENPPDGDLVPLSVPDDLRVSLPPVRSHIHREVNTVCPKKSFSNSETVYILYCLCKKSLPIL